MINLKGQILFPGDKDKATQLQALTGLRAYSPVFAKIMKGYASLKAGVGFGMFGATNSYGLAYDSEIGVCLAKNFLIGLVYNHQTFVLYGEDADRSFYSAFTGLRIGFNF